MSGDRCSDIVPRGLPVAERHRAFDEPSLDPQEVLHQTLGAVFGVELVNADRAIAEAAPELRQVELRVRDRNAPASWPESARHRSQRDLPGILPGCRAPRGRPHREARLVLILGADELRVVEPPHDAFCATKIACRTSPRKPPSSLSGTREARCACVIVTATKS